jgi:hypothetical protein
MIIRYLNLEGVAVRKPEAQPPLVVNTDAVLTRPVTLERFQPIGGRQTQVFNNDGGIQLLESHDGPLQNILGHTPRPADGENLLCLGIGERSYHGLMYKQIVYICQSENEGMEQ